MSITSIFHKVFQKKFKEALQELALLSSIHGLKHVVNNSLYLFERIFWLIIVLFALIGAICISLTQIRRFQDSPTVVSLERDYRTWNGTLPAATICYYDHINLTLAQELIEKFWSVTPEHEDYSYFMDFLYSVVNSTAEEYSDLATFSEDQRFANIDLLEIAIALEKPFDQPVTSYDSSITVKIHKIITEKGVCFALNSPLSVYLTSRNPNKNIKEKPIICQYGRQQCYLQMEISENAAAVAIHSPYEVYSSESEFFDIEKSDEILLKYKVMETVSSPSLRDLSPEQRKCVFHDEHSSGLYTYSKTLCLMRCRAKFAIEMCKCVPFFYPFVDGPRCNPLGFECLNDFRWPVWALHICECPSTCTEIKYKIDSSLRRKWDVNEESTFRPRSTFRWEILPPKIRVRRDVVFSFEDLIVSFGGAISLFLGFSLWSVSDVFFSIYKFLMNKLKNFIMRKIK